MRRTAAEHTAIRATAIVALLASVWLACAPAPARLSDEPDARDARVAAMQGSQAECLPRFPDHGGWYGGDAAYSLPLVDGGADGRRSLWLFGDSFVERAEAPGRRAYPFVHNTIGRSVCTPEGRFQLETFWRTAVGENAGPRAFFEPDPASDWVVEAERAQTAPVYYWPLAAFFAHDALFVGLLRVGTGPPTGPFRLPIRLLGVDLARIENPGDAPLDWRIRVSTLSNDRSAFPGAAFVQAEGFLYAFTFSQRGNGRTPRGLARLPLARLARWRPDLSPQLETLVHDGRWQPGFAPSEAAILMDDDASEMSVHFDGTRRQWISVYLDPTPEEGMDGVAIRRADRVEGPWSAPEILFQLPERLAAEREGGDDNLLCYAGKAHPQFAQTGQLLVTYVCNLFARSNDETLATLRRLATSPELYRPRAVRVAIPEAQASPAWPRSK